ncbi:type III PLP-dependent enzyme [Streptomyces sp. MB09-02B]|nr:type III PLP-dependent enzyme [Streptomyces sp. MB09-02B]MDX3638436.1 type III PLP-dependent enzyme [Streptomyces sp. MB09-02B]
MTDDTAPLFKALAAATEDQIVFDLTGIKRRYDTLRRELPDTAVRFALKACPVDEVLASLAAKGAGVDAASPHEMRQALRAGFPVSRMHYGNTVKSDSDIRAAHRLGLKEFATDNLEDVAAIAVHAPGARVFCRLATDGEGALWGLSRKFGCSPAEAVLVLETARATGLTPWGLSVHVGSQQMSMEAWFGAFDRLTQTLNALARRGIRVDRINLGGGLPAAGYLDKRGIPLDPPFDKIFAVIREGIHRLRERHGSHLGFVIEPGRYLVADHGAIRAHVARLAARQDASGERQHWLYLSCGRFNGLYEMDALQYRLRFPSHPDAEYVSAVLAGPTCDSEDAYSDQHALVRVPRDLASGDPVWVLSCGAYSTSYMAKAFNGFPPLPYTWTEEPYPADSQRPPASVPLRECAADER